MIRVAVLGCGAIGSLYAAHLACLDEVEVWALDPWREHVTAIRAGGLRVTGQADFVAPVHAVTSAGDLPDCRFGIVATKAGHTRDALSAARSALAGASVASVQNGLGNEEVVAEIVPRVIRGTIVTAGAVTAPGTVRYDARGDSWLGPFEPSPAPAEDVAILAGLLTRAGLVTHAVPDARGPQWTKVVFNAATSALSALTGLTVGQVCTDPLLRHQVDRLIREALEVCAASGIVLTGDPVAAVREAVSEAFWHKPSMLQDVLARRATEVDVLNGGIVAQGRRVGVATPGHESMVALVHGVEASWPAAGPSSVPALDRDMDSSLAAE